MNQKIETKLGVIIILIIAVTVGAFLWQWEEKKGDVQTQIPAMPKKINEKNQKYTGDSTKKETQVSLKDIGTGMQDVSTNEGNKADLQKNIQDGVDTNKYTNKTYGFEFKYPKNLVIMPDSTETIFGLGNSSDEPWEINITVNHNTSNLSLSQATSKITERFKSPKKVIVTDIDINGVTAKRYSVENYHDNGNAGTVIIYKDYIIIIYGDDYTTPLRNIFETVINSFKFNK